LIWAAIALAIAPAAQQSPASDSPVHATLRLAGERTAFKMGEPIRLELVITAYKPGYVVDTAGTDDPSDDLTISPTNGVHRLEKRCCRDVVTSATLSESPTVIGLAVNYWGRFDRPGVYQVSVQTRRVSRSDPNGFPREKPTPLETNRVSFRIDAVTLEEEQDLIASAVRNLQSAVMMGVGDGALGAQIKAAEELAFLPGDAAALEKYRQYRELGARLATEFRMASNAYHLLRRGFEMTQNPSVILTAVEADLSNLNEAVTADMISNAASLAVSIKHPDFRPQQGVPMPVVPGVANPYATERARYLDLVHQSLQRRNGLVKLQSAGAMVDVMSKETPPDVVRLIVDRFEEFPPSSRTWLASGRWDVIRDQKLGPALRRTLDEVEPGSRSYIFPALIDIAPGLAVEPISVDILDPKRLISADIVRRIPRSSLSHLAPQLLAVIRTMSNARNADTFRLDKKVELLGIIADGTVRKEAREVYDALPGRYMYGTRESLLRYLLEWDPDEGVKRLKAAVEADSQGTLLYKVAHDGPPVPALNAFLRERVFDQNPRVAAEAAGLLSAERPQDREAIEQRLLLWRVDRQQRIANGEALTEADGTFESALVRSLANGARPQLVASDRERLRNACLTDSCRTALRER
jgi:hypothetical protein